MTSPSRSPAAFRVSLRDRLKTQAKQRGRPMDELEREFVLQRFLGRVFANADSPWILKGAAGLLIRLPGARHSRDRSGRTTTATFRGRGARRRRAPGVHADPLPDQVADKVCAMYEKHGHFAARSSRYRDLVDLVMVIANLPLGRLRSVLFTRGVTRLPSGSLGWRSCGWWMRSMDAGHRTVRTWPAPPGPDRLGSTSAAGGNQGKDPAPWTRADHGDLCSRPLSRRLAGRWPAECGGPQPTRHVRR
jgi:Nucleotidyl transferase AbiEii toxin, Type IV TA system